MEDEQRSSPETKMLTRRLGNAEKSIAFLQREHAETLVHLHEEIAKWQRKFSDLTFQLAVKGPASHSSDDRQCRAREEEYENELRQCQKEIAVLKRLVEEKERLRHECENRLLTNDRQHALQLHSHYDQQQELRHELEHRAVLIAQLTTRLHREKQHQQNLHTRVRLGPMLLSDKPMKLKMTHEELPSKSHSRFYGRSSSVASRTSLSHESSKVLFIGRRPPTPPQQLRSPSSKSIESMDEQLHAPRSRTLFNGPTEIGNAKKAASSRRETKLPPIIHRKIPVRPLVTTVHHHEEKH